MVYDIITLLDVFLGEKGVKRSYYVDQIRPFIDKGLIKVFTGIRRCGKSHIMEMVRDVLLGQGVPASQIVEANFESKVDRKSVV